MFKGYAAFQAQAGMSRNETKPLAARSCSKILDLGPLTVADVPFQDEVPPKG